MADIIPGIGIGEKDFTGIEQKVKLVAPYVGWVQIDFADGTFVPTKTSWEVEKFAALIKSFTGNEHKLSFEAHLMVASPEKYLKQLADAGFRRLIAQVEANDPRLFLEEAQFESVEAGLALDGTTELEVLEPFLEDIDCALIMGGEAGLADDIFQPENIEKVKALHGQLPDLPIEVEEGINRETAKILTEVGVTRLVATSYLFKNTDSTNIAAAIEGFKEV